MATAAPHSVPRTFALATVIGVLVIASYWPALRNQYVWDDDDYIKDLPALREAGGLAKIWTELARPVTPQYYPMVFTTFWAEHRIWDAPDKPEGTTPEPNWFGYHLDNILLHLANALLMWAVLRKLKVPAAWLAAAIFAVHPIEVESVAWASERKNVLCLLFYLLAALAYLRADALTADSAFSPELAAGNAGRPGRAGVWLWLAVTLICFLCALFSKTVTCTFPAAMLVLTWWKRGTITRRDVHWALPMLCAGAVLMFFTASLEAEHVGASGPEWDFSKADRILIAGRALWFYAAKIVWPHPLIFLYPRWRIDPMRVWQWVFPIGAVGILAAMRVWQGRIGRGPMAAALFFAGTLVPALGFVNLFPMRYSFVADHFQYVAGIGVIVLAAVALDRAGRRLIGNAAARGTLVAILLCGLGALTFKQCFIYRDGATLWLDTATKDQTSWISWMNLAAAVTQQPHVGEQLDVIKKAISIASTAPPADKDLQDCLDNPNPQAARWTYLDLARARPKLDERVDEYAKLALERKAVAVAPDCAIPHENLACALAMIDPAAAEREFLIALHMDPQQPETLDDYATFLFENGKYELALDYWNKYVERYSSAASVETVYAKMGQAHEKLKQPDAALSDYATAAAAGLRERSVFGTLKLANALANHGRLNEALAQCESAVQLQPDNYAAQLGVGRMLFVLGRFPEALPHLQTAARLLPKSVEAHSSLSSEYAAMQQEDGVLHELEILQSLDPQNPDWPKQIAALRRAGAPATSP